MPVRPRCHVVGRRRTFRDAGLLRNEGSLLDMNKGGQESFDSQGPLNIEQYVQFLFDTTCDKKLKSTRRAPAVGRCVPHGNQ